MRARLRSLVVIGAVVGVPLTAPITAQAASTVTAGEAFVCQAHFPAWPAYALPGDCTISGLPLPGHNSAGLSAGLDSGGHPWFAAGAALSSARFNYDESCLAGDPPLVATADGSLTSTMKADSSLVVDNGSVTTGTWEAGFHWIRVGLSLLVFFGPATWTFGTGRTATSLVTLPVPAPDGYPGGSSGVAVAAFVPETVPLPTCGTPGPLNADVVAAGAWGA